MERSSYVDHCSFSLVGLWSNKREAILCCSLYVQRTGEKCDEGGHVRLVETWRILGRKLSLQAAYWSMDERLSANETAEIGASRKVGTLFGQSCIGRHRCNFIQREAKVTVMLMLSSVEEQCKPQLCAASLHLSTSLYFLKVHLNFNKV